jgi:hypothetical protein
MAGTRGTPAGDSLLGAPVRTVTELRLSDSVRLLVDGEVSGLPSIDALRAAAAPLLQLLATNPAAPD